MKKILMFCACILLSSNIQHTNPKHFSNKLPNFISTNYKVSIGQAHKVVYYATMKTNSSFPTRDDVLAIMSIESGFKTDSISKKKAIGLMQILYKETNGDADNVESGVALLREYNYILKSEKAAIIAYNVGISNYKKGVRNTKFYIKYLKELKKLSSID